MKIWAHSSAVQGRRGEPGQNGAHAGTWRSVWTADCSASAADTTVRVSPQHLPLPILVECTALLLADGVYRCLHRAQLSEVNDKMLAVQECYISVCKEKDMLEERIQNSEKEGAVICENEVWE